MKHIFIFAIMWLLVTFRSFATETNAPVYTLNLHDVEVSRVLDIYTNTTGVALEIDPHCIFRGSIDFKTLHPLTKDETAKRLEKALKEQAGIVITHVDDKRARVTYDASVRVARPKQEIPAGREVVALTAKDVDPNSVRVTTGPDIPTPNLVFNFVGKTSDEIKAIVHKHPWIQIKKGGFVVAETGSVSLISSRGRTNYVGLVLIFDDYKMAKLAEKTLRGN
jgi:hypothetical protein